jgi:hypothetical protein
VADVPAAETLEPGNHVTEVRPTHKTGYTQTSDRDAPIPNGASGWHPAQFTVLPNPSRETRRCGLSPTQALAVAFFGWALRGSRKDRRQIVSREQAQLRDVVAAWCAMAHDLGQ